MDRSHLEAIVSAVTNELEGEWLLLGGGLVALWLDHARTTEDVDLVGMRGDARERHELMHLAIRLGLPIEAINSAADFFVRRIEDWREEIEPMLSGAKGTIYRPSPTLFLLLKIGRLSPQDLADCEALLARVDDETLPLDRARVERALADLPPTADRALLERRERLGALLRR